MATQGSHQPFFTRISFLLAGLFFVGGIFMFDLFSKQVVQHAEYAEAAAAQSTNITPEPAARGQIYATDKDGKLYSLAVSEWQYQLLISPRQVKNSDALISHLKRFLPELDQTTVSAKIDNDKVYVPPVMEGIDAVTAGKITEENLAGVFLKPKLVRVYPDGQNIAPQTLGFVGADGRGKYGLEQYYDNVLQGKSGSQTTQRDSLGRLIDILGNSQPQPGSDLVLSLDYNLQFTVETKLAEAVKNFQADSGSVIVMDAKTGAVLAMASDPDYDPNKYSEIPTDQNRIYQARAISDVYEPGSVIKPVTMAAALDLELVQPETTHNAGPSVEVNGYTILNALNKNFGTQNMSQVIQNSDNIQMVWISSLLGAEKEREYFAKFGLGSKTGVDIAGEQVGRLPKLPWPDILRSTAAFGQGISTTVIQLAAQYAVLANGGTTVSPHIVEKIVTGNQAVKQKGVTGQRVVSNQAAKEVTQMLVDTVNLGEGRRAGVNGVQVAGKTGTAQVPSPNGGYDTNRSIGTFAGFFPADDPRFVMVVRLDDPKTVSFAESSAAPTFGSIASWMANYYSLR